MAEAKRNIEIKCRCAELSGVAARARTLGARDAGVLLQTDTFFRAPDARLKLRDFGDGRAELISYRRADAVTARGSDYLVCPVAEASLLAATLEHALGSTGTVRKRRHLFLHQHTRIHLDDVVGLGTFVELETVISEQTDAEAQNELVDIAVALGLDLERDSVPVPYVELLRQARGAT
jgi:predicted adenylyl cyclase CyaB